MLPNCVSKGLPFRRMYKGHATKCKEKKKGSEDWAPFSEEQKP